MSREWFKDVNFRPRSLALINRCCEVVDAYQAQGLRLTLRQLYYQLVSANDIPNEEKSYKNLGSLVSDARLAGLIDWDAIEDRVRQPRRPPEFDDLRDLVRAAVASYRLPRWRGQGTYAELWVEKDALAGVLEPVAREYHVTLMVNRGYSSQSAMYESAKRFVEREEEGRQLRLFYLGDHDPSGEDMVRDVEDRLRMLGVDADGSAGLFEVTKIALTMEQIRKYKPPPNPAKLTDSRAAAYVAKYGTSSWEVDALPPNVLVRLIRAALDAVVDKELMDAVKKREEFDKERLEAAVEDIMAEEDGE